MRIGYLVLSLTLSLTSYGQWQQSSEAPQEPPYLTEEEWEAENTDTQLPPKAESNLGYEIVEETDDYLKVRHPEAKNGLRRITADGTYIYERDKSPIESYMGFRFSSQRFEQIQLDTGSSIVDFQDIYTSNASIFLDYEDPIGGPTSNLKWNYGGSLIFSTGKGVFANGDPSFEDYTLIMLPVHGGISYHFQYLGETQWIIPYVATGASLFFIREFRADGEANNTYTAGFYGAGGIRFLLDRWMDDAQDLDEDFGINHSWFTIEFRRIQGAERAGSSPEAVDISSSVLGLGFGFDI